MSDSLLARWIPSFLRMRDHDGEKAMVHSGVGGQGSLFSSLFFSAGSLLPGTKHDYAREVGDGLGSSVLAGPLNFLMRTFPEAPVIVERRKDQGWEEEPEHDLIRLIENPNPFYGGRVLWMCSVLDFAWGEFFWYKVRNAAGRPVELWWIPRQLIVPRYPADGSVFVDHYDYRPGPGGTKELPVRDVVHVRFGIDPRNPRRGLSQLGALMREVGMDDEAANFTASILRNLGIVGLVVSPEGPGPVSDEALKETREYIEKQFTGDKRGGVFASRRPTKVQLLQYQMQGVDVSPIRDVSEERVCAALGFPAAVVGFGTGLQQTKVGATMKEMRQLAWTGGLIPMQEIIADEIRRQVLPDFEAPATGSRARVRFDTSKVRALWEDTNEKHDRVRKDFQAKVIDRAEARRETGRAVRPDDEGVYYNGPAPADPSIPIPANPPPAGGTP